MKEINGKVAILISIILALSLIASAYIVTEGVKDIKGGNKALTVTGSAKNKIESDFIIWRGQFTVDNASLSTGYQEIKSDFEIVQTYFKNLGITEDEITFSPVNTYGRNKILDNGVYTNIIDSYNLSQTVEIRSIRVLEVAEIGRNSTNLIEEGVNFNSYNPEYLYTKLADLKIEMIGLATEDAKARADKLLSVTGNSSGKLNSARIGVFQITPLYSNEIESYGINDTSSYEKEITSVVTCDFEVK